MDPNVVDRVPPSPLTVIGEQLRGVGLAIRREAVAAFVLAGLPTLALAVLVRLSVLRLAVDDSNALDPGPGLGILAAALAVLFPLLVWKSERPFGDSLLWSLPADHRRHALTKVAVGWAWLMALVGVALLWLAAVVLLSGGSLGSESTRLLIIDRAGAEAGLAGTLESVRWTTPWWQWLLPFTAGTAGYLLASAFFLGIRHPLRWIVGGWLLVLAIGILGEEADVQWLASGFELIHSWVDMLLTSGEALRTRVTLPSGERTAAWVALPSAGRWAAVSVTWIALGVAGVLAASARPRDH